MDERGELLHTFPLGRRERAIVVVFIPALLLGLSTLAYIFALAVAHAVSVGFSEMRDLFAIVLILLVGGNAAFFGLFYARAGSIRVYVHGVDHRQAWPSEVILGRTYHPWSEFERAEIDTIPFRDRRTGESKHTRRLRLIRANGRRPLPFADWTHPEVDSVLSVLRDHTRLPVVKVEAKPAARRGRTRNRGESVFRER